MYIHVIRTKDLRAPGSHTRVHRNQPFKYWCIRTDGYTYWHSKIVFRIFICAYVLFDFLLVFGGCGGLHRKI